MNLAARLGIRLAALLAVSWLGSACAPVYLRGGELPPAGPAQRGDGARPTAALLLGGALSPAAARDLVKQVTADDAPFRAFDIVGTEPPADAVDYRLTLDVMVGPGQPLKSGVGAALVQGFGHVLTLGLVPLPIERDQLVLVAVVRDRHDAEVARYVLQDSIVGIQQTATILLPVGVFASRERATTGAIANMLRTVYRRMAADGLLDAPR